MSWREYEAIASKKYGKTLARVRYLEKRICPNDLIWTRDTDGGYYLAKVNSPWEYYTNPSAQAADITNICRCRILKVPNVDDVPGKVIACFRSPMSIQRIRDSSTVQYSCYLWNELSKSPDYATSNTKEVDIFSLLSAEETEDVIFIYLQLNGWIVVPNSRKADTMRYEFYLINKETGGKAVVQVKTGGTQVNPELWAASKEKVFLFQSKGNYTGSSRDNVQILYSQDIRQFIFNNLDVMPSTIRRWAEITKNM